MGDACFCGEFYGDLTGDVFWGDDSSDCEGEELLLDSETSR
jgi:hypothetical protein